MPIVTYAYRAKAANGGIMEGVIEAAELRVAKQKLKAQNLTVLDIAPKTRTFKDLIKEYNPMKPKPTTADLVIFSRQMSTMVSAGVPIVQSLSILESQAENPPFKLALTSIRQDIESGVSIADAMDKQPDAFPPLYVSMIRAGEVGGILDTIMQRLSGFMESAEALKAKVKSAMMYPAVVVSVSFAVTVFLMVGVIPTFKEIFASFNAKLPLPTEILITISDGMRHYFYLVIAIPIGIVYGIMRWYKTETGREKMDTWSLKVPVFGILLKKVAIAKFTRTLGTLLKSGVPIMQALDTVAATAGNVVVQKAIRSAREAVKEGQRMTDPLKDAHVFPNMVIQMIAVGEETGSLDQMLNKIADFYDQEVDAAVKGLTSMIEPLVIVFLGTVVGAIVICMFMPMFEMGELASK
ncbi:MAG: type II secretion system F family protein [Elusimicrobia bacterium]|nr:type II secretion system F family protein [Elusimicrobiota bacterium]